MAKTSGSTSEYADERSQALMEEYERYIKASDYVVMTDVCKHIVNRPCPRFWVSNIRAAVVIANMMKGDKLNNMRPTKREMFYEIFNRVKKLKLKYPHMSLYQLTSLATSQPAPKFYLTPGSAYIMIYKARKQWYRKKLQRLHR